MANVCYYSVYDVVADDFAPIFPARNDADAVRSYKVILSSSKQKNLQFVDSDYRLYHICDFDEHYKACHHDNRLVEVTDNE